MKTLEYTFRDDKAEWGEGPWQNEPDKMQWQDKETGLPCLVVRGPLGAWCGYVGVAEGHPAFNQEYDDVQSGEYDWEKHEYIKPAIVPDVSAHGGLTFSGFCVEDGKEHGICHLVEPGENDRVWWLGFDCAHMNDYVPGLDATLKEVGHEWPTNEDPMFARTYKTIEYTRASCRMLAKSLAVRRIEKANP